MGNIYSPEVVEAYNKKTINSIKEHFDNFNKKKEKRNIIDIFTNYVTSNI